MKLQSDCSECTRLKNELINEQCKRREAEVKLAEFRRQIRVMIGEVAKDENVSSD